MNATSDRRNFLKSALGAAAALPLGLLGARAHSRSQTTSLSVEHLTDSLLLISGSGCNIVALKGPDGVLMVDGGSADRSAEVLQAIEHEFGSAPRILFNTHWHPEHVGCNERVGKAGGKIIAHENNKKEQEKALSAGGRGAPPAGYLPTVLVTKNKESMKIEGVKFDLYHWANAHTSGDLIVSLPAEKIVFTGDIIATQII